MSRAELLAKMTARGAAITGAGFGGKAAITAADVAGACGMGRLSYPAYLFGLLKYCALTSVLGRIDRIVRGHVFMVGKSEGWDLTDAQVEGLARLVLLENLHDPVCQACNGSGTVAAKACEPCAGAGRVPMSDRQRAQVAGIPETSWRRTWAPRAKRCHAIVQAWDAELADHLQRQLGAGAGLTEDERERLRTGS